MFQDPCGKRVQQSLKQKHVGLFTDLQVVFPMLKPAKIKQCILKFAARRFARLQASPFASLRSPPPAMSCGRLVCRRPFDFLSHERVRLLCFFPFLLLYIFPSLFFFLFPHPLLVVPPFPLSLSFLDARRIDHLTSEVE
jgi:hypothetical protein